MTNFTNFRDGISITALASLFVWISDVGKALNISFYIIARIQAAALTASKPHINDYVNMGSVVLVVRFSDLFRRSLGRRLVHMVPFDR